MDHYHTPHPASPVPLVRRHPSTPKPPASSAGHQTALPNATAHSDPNTHPSTPGIPMGQGVASQLPRADGSSGLNSIPVGHRPFLAILFCHGDNADSTQLEHSAGSRALPAPMASTACSPAPGPREVVPEQRGNGKQGGGDEIEQRQCTIRG